MIRTMITPQLDLYKIFVHSKAFLHKSTILVLPRPPALPTRLQYDCKTFPQQTTPLPTLLLYAIHHTILVITILCKGQSPTPPPYTSYTSGEPTTTNTTSNSTQTHCSNQPEYALEASALFHVRVNQCISALVTPLPPPTTTTTSPHTPHSNQSKNPVSLQISFLVSVH